MGNDNRQKSKIKENYSLIMKSQINSILAYVVSDSQTSHTDVFHSFQDPSYYEHDLIVIHYSHHPII